MISHSGREEVHTIEDCSGKKLLKTLPKGKLSLTLKDLLSAVDQSSRHYIARKVAV